MSKSTTTHRAAIKALASLVKVTADLEHRLASLAECIELDAEVDALLRDAGHAMARAERVLEDTAAVSPVDQYTAAKQAKQAAKQAIQKQA